MNNSFVSPFAINQYMTFEAQAMYYFQILGWLAENENTFWNWSDGQIHKDIAMLAGNTGVFNGLNVTGIFPSISARMHQLMRRAYTRGFIFGMRRSTGEMGIPLPLDFLNPYPAGEEPDVPWGEHIEIDLDVFDE